MATFKHPAFDEITRDVAEDDAADWAAQGWIRTDVPAEPLDKPEPENAPKPAKK
jgi:hypothetical protein